jgi:hypothetical protein
LNGECGNGIAGKRQPSVGVSVSAEMPTFSWDARLVKWLGVASSANANIANAENAAETANCLLIVTIETPCAPNSEQSRYCNAAFWEK